MTSADVISAYITGERWMKKYTGGLERPSPNQIAQLAYQLYEERGRQDGHHIEDWLLAEQRLTPHQR
jgi:hypothetical protein